MDIATAKAEATTRTRLSHTHQVGYSRVNAPPRLIIKWDTSFLKP